MLNTLKTIVGDTFLQYRQLTGLFRLAKTGSGQYGYLF